MAGPEDASTALAVPARADLEETQGDSEPRELTVGPLKPTRANPVDVYEATLKSDESKEALAKALRRVLRATEQDDRAWRRTRWAALTFEHMAVIRSALDRGFAPATVRVTLSMLKGVLHTAWRLGQLDSDRLLRVTDWAPVRGKRAPVGRQVPKEHIAALRRYCERQPAFLGALTWALLSLGFGAGLRRAELAELPADGALVDQDRRIVVRGKGDKVRTVPLEPGVAGAVEDWLAQRERFAEWLEARGKTIVPTMFLSVSPSREPRNLSLNCWGVWKVIRDAADGARVPRFAPHDMRRTFATVLLNSGVPVKHVQALLGHENASTTMLYDRSEELEIAKSAQRIGALFAA